MLPHPWTLEPKRVIVIPVALSMDHTSATPYERPVLLADIRFLGETIATGITPFMTAEWRNLGKPGNIDEVRFKDSNKVIILLGVGDHFCSDMEMAAVGRTLATWLLERRQELDACIVVDPSQPRCYNLAANLLVGTIGALGDRNDWRNVPVAPFILLPHEDLLTPRAQQGMKDLVTIGVPIRTAFHRLSKMAERLRHPLQTGDRVLQRALDRLERRIGLGVDLAPFRVRAR